jgi:LacI family transcriptional regulator
MKKPHVALLIETSTTWGSEIVQGIAEYAHDHTDWLIHFEPRGKYERLRIPENWDGDGVIARVTHKALADQILKAGIPAVNVSWYNFGEGHVPRCTSDERRAGEMIARHFIERGFRNYAYVGPIRRPKYVDLFGKAFEDALKDSGFTCKHYVEESSSTESDAWVKELAHLSKWVWGLPKPVAVLAFSDVRGRQVAEACRLAGVQVPQDVALLGGEHDVLSCEVSKPKLSSLDQSPRVVGREAAALLSRMLAGEPPPKDPILIPPARIITRQSTDTLAVDDPLLLDAIGFIMSNANRSITVKDVLRHISVSRRVLEQRFQSVLGRSPGAEIRRVRIERVKQLLAETKLPLARIAQQCGFHHAEVMTRVFRRFEGLTPSAYRSRCQGILRQPVANF